ncbi:fibro-slime domain-containing protein [Fibrobacter sp.]|uniref:fibro-slime domain-containing protein n=1 Tax=Fibrobacter sp. TaxID=35828 RepID=UPI00388E4D79
MNKLFKKIFAVALLAGVQSVFATLNCNQFGEGTVYLKLPTGWNSAYAVSMGGQNKFTASKTYPGWYEISTAEIGGSYSGRTEFYISNAPSYICYDSYAKCISSTQMNVDGMQTNLNNFSCDDFNRATGELWISEDPDHPTVPIVGKEAPGAKFLYVLIPNDADWKSSVPMYSTDGTYAGGKPLSVASDMCGWYYAMWLDEEPPSNMIVFMDTDTELENAIGIDGLNADELKPIDMPTMFDLYGTDKLYFVPDMDLWDEVGERSLGFYDSDPGLSDPSLCSYSLAALIYDTDASLHGAFTCDAYPMEGSNGCYSATAKYNYPGNGAVNTVPCIGVKKGIVQKTLEHADKNDPYYKKPRYNASSGCFVSEEAFDVMFRETEGINFQHCRDVPFTLSKDGLWEYDSFNEPTGAFTPLNDLADSVKAGLCTGICAMAATLREGTGNVKYGEGTAMTVSRAATAALGNVANWGAKNPLTGLPYIDSYPVSDGEFASGTTPDVYDNTTWDARIESNSNQMFCFESHAKFQYRPGMKFYFRGDDDIWVFIDNTLAVDLGGTHLAAPAAVDLDKFTGENGALQVGQQYDIDIFFCDRRTDMSNVRIKTNMYIQQTGGLQKKIKKDGSLGFCYTRVVDGSCGAIAMGVAEIDTICDDLSDIVDILYSIETLKGTVVAENLVPGEPTSIYFGGIDLTNSSSPVINKKKLTGLAPGRYNLVARVVGDNGKPVKIPFRVSGALGILPSQGVALDSNGIVCNQTSCPEIANAYYKFESASMVGTYLPVYISSIGAKNEDGAYDLDVLAAVGEEYVFDAGKLSAFVKTTDEDSGEEKFVPLAEGTERTIGPSGVDTVYVTISMENFTKKVEQFWVSLGDDSDEVPVTFFIPEIAFVDESGDVFTGDESGNELWVGASYSFQLKAFVPALDGDERTFCENCDFAVVRGEKTSSGIQMVGDTLVNFKNGLATVQIRSVKEYRYDESSSKARPAKLQVVAEKSSLIEATIKPLYFREPDIAYPLFADVFDVVGSVQEDLLLPVSYYSPETEYLDGIADSIVVYFNKKLSRISLPDSIVVHWDSEMDPLVLGKDEIQEACASSLDEDELLCSNYLGFGHLKLSKDVKTSGIGVVDSWASVEDESGEENVYRFTGNIVDRIAPVPLSASLTYSKTEDNVEMVEILMSEPVRIKKADYELKAVDFYRFADGLSKSQRYGHPEANEIDVEDSIVVMQFKVDGKAPQAGDYLRLRADHSIWADMVTLDDGDKRSESDASYKWNSPTTYDATKRLPSPWVPVTLAKINPNDYDGAIYAKPTFRVVLTGSFTFKIVFKDSAKNAQKSYSVMDLNGGVVKSGAISGDETSVSVKNAGSYIVRVGRGSQLVNFK